MDATTERLVDFALQAQYAALPPEAVHECKRRLIDTFGSAIGAYDEPLSGMARKIALRSRGDSMATIWGSTAAATPEAAAFANGVMLRFLDVSDTYLGKSRGHPSDMIAGILAVAESVHADGASVINAVAIAYDVYCSFCQAVDVNSKGLDQPVYAILGAVVGAGKLLGLTREQMGHAVSLALVPNLALAQSRQGELSAWKGCAGANAARNAVFAAALAQEGFTGPEAAFEGAGGLWDIVGRFDWPLPNGTHMVTQSHIKSVPVCYHGQSAVIAAFDLRGRVDVNGIEEIEVEGYRAAVLMMGNDASRWAPATRETADHSMPYVIAIALLDGRVTSGSFAPARLTDPQVAALMRKVKVRESAELTAQYPEAAPARLQIRMASGAVHKAEIKYPTGHARQPMDDAELERKFCELFAAHGNETRAKAVLGALWKLDTAKDVGPEVIALMASDPR